MEITLGMECRDSISGFVGKVTGIVYYITGCKQALLTPGVGVDGAYREPQWFDVDRLGIVTADPVVLSGHTAAAKGFDKSAPKR